MANAVDLIGTLGARDISALTTTEALDLVAGLQKVRTAINLQFVNPERRDLAHILELWTAQSQIFVVDCLPHILKVLRQHHLRRDTVSMLDIGAATGAGTSLLKTLLSNNMLWCRVEVTGIDLFGHRLICAKNNYPDFDYLIGDIFGHEGVYDYVFCSHVVEHVPGTEIFIKRMTEMCRKNVFVYTPFEEAELIQGHRNRISKQTYANFDVSEFIEIKSAGWRWGKPDSDMCLLAILKGKAA